ncbi:MAG: hypothetical protein IJS54_01585 [Desulfovibrio sp.]|nr:hypothetical protein [Desulfovibrio sp.]
MGEALQIRVSAVTWNEDLLEKLWPHLTELAATVPSHSEKHGVLELVQTLSDGLRFMDWDPKYKERLRPGIEKAQALRLALEDALACWKPKEANALSEQLETALDDLERVVLPKNV